MPCPFVPPDETKRSYHSGLTGPIVQPPESATVFDPVDYASYTLRAPAEVAREVPVARDDSVLSFSFETGKYRPPFRVTVRTDVDQWKVDHEGKFADGIWVFTLPGPQYARELYMKLVLDGHFWMAGDDVKIPREKRHRHFVDREVYFAYQVRFQTGLWRPNHLVTLRTCAGWGRDLFGVFAGDTWSFYLDRAEHPASFQAKFVLDRQAFMAGPDLSIAADNPYPLFTDADVRFPGNPTAYRHGYDNFLPVEGPLEQVTVRAAGTQDEVYDVIVVGSGMGGGTLADALSDRGMRTLVLEAGGLWFPVHMNELPGSEIDLARRDELGHFVNQPGSSLLFGVHFNLGGRSVYWSGLIPRMRAWEMRAWPDSVRRYLTQPGQDGRSGYDRAEKLMRKGKTLGPFQDRVREHLCRALGGDFDVLDLPRSLHQPNLDDHGRITNVLQKPTGVFSTADLLLDSLGFTARAGRENLRVNLHHLATRVETSAGRATAVVCQDLVGRAERRYRGRHIVLACGSLESPRLAINSQLTDRNAKMGRGLTDHPAYFYNIHHELPTTGQVGWIGDPHGHAKLLLQHRRSTPTEHAYNVELLINPKYWDARHADDDLWRKLLEEQQRSKVEIKFQFDSPLVEGNYIRPRDGEKSEVFVAPNLSARKYRDEIVEVRNRVLTALGVSGLSTRWDDHEWGEGSHGTVHHAGGTLRMSADGSGVVDDNLKFLDYENLYCCDVSVYPGIPAANPSLTLVALALRLADTLAGPGRGRYS